MRNCYNVLHHYRICQTMIMLYDFEKVSGKVHQTLGNDVHQMSSKTSYAILLKRPMLITRTAV